MRQLGYIISGLVGAVAMLALIMGLEMQSATARTEAGRSIQTINRALKGDRLPVPVELRIPARKPASLAPTQRLPDGCEAAISAIIRTPLARSPARCVS